MKIKDILLLLSIIVLIFCISFFQITKEKKEEPILTNYNLEIEENLINFEIIENSIFYLTYESHEENEGNYYLKEFDLKTKQSKLINKIGNTNKSCSLKNEWVTCSNDEEITLYNNKEVLNYKLKDEKEAYIIPYKDNFLLIKDNSLYLLKNKETYFKALTIDLKEYNIFDYFITKNNTYILFKNDTNFILYDVNEEKEETLEYDNYYPYSSGFLFINKDKIKVINLENNNNNTYTNQYQESYFYAASLNNNILSLYDALNDKLLFLNLEDNTILDYKHDFTNSNPITIIKNFNNKVYFYCLQDTNNFYELDITKINISENIEEYLKKENQELTDKVESLKEKYNINIKIKDETVLEYPDFYAEVEKDKQTILTALNKIDTILSKFDKEFFNNFYLKNYKGLNIYLTGALTPSDYATQVANPAAFSLIKDYQYMIVININEPNIEELTCHELEHNIEFNAIKMNKQMLEEWNNYNPDNFSYNYSYTDKTTLKYTLNENNNADVYFVDAYSKTYPTEDRARIFESICTNKIDLKEYPNLYKKANYIKEELIKNYPTLNNTTLFN